MRSVHITSEMGKEIYRKALDLKLLYNVITNFIGFGFTDELTNKLISSTTKSVCTFY